MSLLDVVFVDDHLAILNKPSGLLSVPGRGEDKQDCLIARAQTLWPEALTVHRLDMATSGLMVIARGPDMQRKLSHAFAQRDVHKIYEAIVSGELHSPETDDTEAWHEHGKPSHTHWRVKNSNSNLNSNHTTRVELKPMTGRTHQLRLHMMGIGHPILGDALYASPDIQAQSSRLLLHARVLQFKHPFTAEWMAFESIVPF